MILSLSAIWGGTAVEPLAGDAQVFDGSLDYDTLSYTAQAQAQPFAYMFDYNFEVKKTNVGIWSDVQSNIGLELFVESTGKLRFLIVNGSGNLYYINTTETIGTGRNNIIFTWDGSGANVYLNGTLLTRNVLANTLSGYASSTRTANIGARPAGSDKLRGKVKTVEIINRVPTAQEIADGSTGGSFRSAGIAYNSGAYFLAVDFNKVDGNPPTTFANTPLYTITAYGGATYTTYL